MPLLYITSKIFSVTGNLTEKIHVINQPVIVNMNLDLTVSLRWFAQNKAIILCVMQLSCIGIHFMNQMYT